MFGGFFFRDLDLKGFLVLSSKILDLGFRILIFGVLIFGVLNLGIFRIWRVFFLLRLLYKD